MCSAIAMYHPRGGAVVLSFSAIGRGPALTRHYGVIWTRREWCERLGILYGIKYQRDALPLVGHGILYDIKYLKNYGNNTIR